ncbi:hypothetical protein [Niallia sp. FSL W8-0635]|uniref:hypothetical protein n=1 Tax=Niallia sp. FSL W8-0635 TaxID=2975337 RepID=UPI0009CC8FDC|nr:Uncharacterised protein [Mycobacteroides abscessus subsp. abscessus]HEO8420802.1 hypothetical protein [Yersinia enterocolitica]
MEEQKGSKLPNFDALTDRVIAEDSDVPSVSIKTNVDPKNVLEDNPYFDNTKTYSEEELAKLKKFFGG